MAERGVVRKYIYVWEVPVRLAHWGIFASIVILVFTGSYIHYPFINVTSIEQPYLMGVMRTIHYITGTIFMFFVLLRIYLFFIGNEYASWRGSYSPFNKKDIKLYSNQRPKVYL